MSYPPYGLDHEQSGQLYPDPAAEQGHGSTKSLGAKPQSGALGQVTPPNYGSTAPPGAPAVAPPAMPYPPAGAAPNQNSGHPPHENKGAPPGGRGKQYPPGLGFSGVGPPIPNQPTATQDISPWQPGPGERTMYDGADMPGSDVPEDHAGREPIPLGPDLSKLPKIQGYEDIGYHGDVKPQKKRHAASAPSVPPPPYEAVANQPQEQPEENYSSVAHISESQAREALLEHVSHHCCYGKGAARSMQIEKVTPSSALHYTLESFTESRSTTWTQEPYRGQAVDTAQFGLAPLPWSISVQPSKQFNSETQQVEVPHTASIMPCRGCGAMGWIRCHSCMGRGFKRCLSCHGSGREWKTDAHGHRHVESCWHCHGTGRKRCLSCGGDGRVVCRTCQGYRQLKCYIQLTVTFNNHTSDHVVEKTDMPDKLVKSVGGVTLFEQSLPRVWPISYFPDKDICEGSQRLINKHAEDYKPTRILMQKQQLRAVPVSECSFKWKNKPGRYWVYGNEHKVYAPKYPQKCCCGCAIL